MADGDAPVSRALLLSCAAVSLLCSLHTLLLAPQSLPGHGGTVPRKGDVKGGQWVLGEGGEGAEAGFRTGVGVLAVLCEWLAWPTMAETVVGSILLLRLFSCERHVGSMRVASFFVCALAVSAACAIGVIVLRKVAGVGAAATAGLACRGWAPSVVYGALLVRHLVEVPTRARFLLLGRAHVSDKSVEVLLALQVTPTHYATRHAHTHEHKSCAHAHEEKTHAHTQATLCVCVDMLMIYSDRWQCAGAQALSSPSPPGSSLAWHLPTYNRSNA